MNRVTLKPPPFWKKCPSIWFAEIEAQFSLSWITNNTIKYFHVISAIDIEILIQVSYIIQILQEKGKYSLLKTWLIDMYTNSYEKKLRKLHSEVELRNKNLWTLLNEMLRLGGESLISEFLKSYCLQHLSMT